MYIKGLSPSVQVDPTPSTSTANSTPGLAIRTSSTSEDCEASPIDCPFDGKRLKSVVVEVSRNLPLTKTPEDDGDISKKDSRVDNLSAKTVDLKRESKAGDMVDGRSHISEKHPAVEVQGDDSKLEQVSDRDT